MSLTRRWLYTLNLFFVIFTAVLLGQYLLGPESGRLSTLECKPNNRGKSVCTVRIYGIRKIYRRDFYADDYIGILGSDTFPLHHTSPYLDELALPWGSISGDATSLGHVCAVSIRTGPQVIDFVPPYQSHANCQRATEQLAAAFAGDRNKIDLRFNGYNPFIYVMAGLIVIAGILLVRQSVPGFVLWIQRYRAARREQNSQLQGAAEAGSPGAEKVDAGDSHHSEPVNRSFILKWWAATVLVVLFVLFGLIIAGLGKRGSAINTCFLSIRDYQGLLLRPLLRNLVAISPLVTLTTLMAALQWQVLRSHLQVSRWWMAAPIVVAVPLLFALPASLQCADAMLLSFPVLIPAPDHAFGLLNVTIYFLLVGITQWLILRRNLKFAIGWAIIPFLEAVIKGILFLWLFSLFLYDIPSLNIRLFESLFIPYAIVAIPLMLVLLTSFSFLAGYYLYRLLRLRSQVPPRDIRDGNEAVAR